MVTATAVCVHVCSRVRVRACACVRAHACARARACARVCACVYARVRVGMRDVFAIYDKIFDPG